MSTTERRLDAAFWALRAVLGTGMFLAGIDKFFNVLTTWSMYVSALAERVMPVKDTTFLRAVGCLEIAIGLCIVTRWTRIASYVMSVWVLAIALNLAVSGSFWDLFLRDVEIATAAFVLARLAEWRKEALARSFEPGRLGNNVATQGPRMGIVPAPGKE